MEFDFYKLDERVWLRMISKLVPVTVVIKTKNEEKNIEACINSAMDFSQVIVVDSLSTDLTKSLAISSGAEIVDFEWNGKYPKKSQWILENCNFKNEWVLFVDADERITPELTNEIREFIETKGNSYAAAELRLRYFFGKNELKFGHKFRKLALLRRTLIEFPRINDLEAPGMGELEGHYQPTVFGKVFRLKNFLIHRDIDPLRTLFIRHVNYASWEAFLSSDPELRFKVNKQKSGHSWIFHRMKFKSVLFFLYSYIIRLGFLDKRAGLDFALTLSWYYWMIEVLKKDIRN